MFNVIIKGYCSYSVMTYDTVQIATNAINVHNFTISTFLFSFRTKILIGIAPSAPNIIKEDATKPDILLE